MYIHITDTTPLLLMLYNHVPSLQSGIKRNNLAFVRFLLFHGFTKLAVILIIGEIVDEGMKMVATSNSALILFPSINFKLKSGY